MAIVIYSLAISATLIVFLLLAQPLGMRFDYANEENLRLIDIVLPTFLGYLGAASHFLFNSNRGRDVDRDSLPLLKLLVHGPFLIFIIAVSALFFDYYVTHRPLGENEARIEPLTFNQLSRYFSICLALLSATVGVVSSYLFGFSPSTARSTAAKKKNRTAGS